MRDNTRYRIAESRRIYRALVWWIAVLVASVILLSFPEAQQRTPILASCITIIIVSLVAISLNILLVRGLKRNEPEPPANDASDTPLFSEQRQADMRLEVHEDSMTRLGRFRFTQSQWRLLAVALSDKGWKWTRRNIGEAGIFTSLTAPGVYGEITEDFERLGIVDNGRVTAQGRDKLCGMAGTPLL